MKINFQDINPYQILKLVNNYFIVIIALAIIFIFSLFSIRSIFYPYTIDYTEGHVLALSWLQFEKGTYFLDIHNYPMIVGTYTPIYIYLTSFFIKIFGVQYFIGRCISVLSSLCVLAMLYKLFLIKSKKFIISFLLAITFIAAPYIVRWSSMNRPDLLAIAFSLFGLLLYYLYEEKKSFIKYFSILFFLLAFFTKQSAIAAPLSIIIYSAFKNRKEMFYFLSAYVLSMVAVFYFFNYVTRGLFYTHTITYMGYVSPLRLSLLPGIYQNFLQTNIIFSLLVIINLLSFKKYGLFSFYFFINFLLISIQSKPGGNINLLIEPYLSLIILGGLLFIEILKIIKNYKYKLAVYMLLSVQLFLITNFQMSGLPSNPFVSAIYDQGSAIDYYVKKAKGPILSDDLGSLILNNKELFYEPFSFRIMSIYNKSENNNKVANDICGRKFDLIVAGENILHTVDLMNCIAREYFLMDKFNDFDIYFSKEVGAID